MQFLKSFSFRIEITDGSPDWYKYFLCGVKGVTEKFASAKYFGMKVLVSGNIPPASGLSSSSALVSAATLATSYANKVSISMFFSKLMLIICVFLS